MDLTLNIYETRLCRKVEKTVTAQTFELSTGICEDVLDVLNLDMFEGGLASLSNESLVELAVPIVRNGFPFFKSLLAEIFEVTEEELKRTKITEVARVIVAVVKYSIDQLKTLGGNNPKNA